MKPNPGSFLTSSIDHCLTICWPIRSSVITGTTWTKEFLGERNTVPCKWIRGQRKNCSVCYGLNTPVLLLICMCSSAENTITYALKDNTQTIGQHTEDRPKYDCNFLYLLILKLFFRTAERPSTASVKRRLNKVIWWLMLIDMNFEIWWIQVSEIQNAVRINEINSVVHHIREVFDDTEATGLVHSFYSGIGIRIRSFTARRGFYSEMLAGRARL